MKGGTCAMQRKKEAEAWYHDLMHYIHDTGKYAERKRKLLRKYHPEQDYIGLTGFDENRNPFCKYYLLPMQWHKHSLNHVKATGNFHCERCKLMGNLSTFQHYHCLAHSEPVE